MSLPSAQSSPAIAAGTAGGPIDAARLFEARLLHRLEQGLRTRLPALWQALEPPRGGQRAAAGVLLRLSEEPSWQRMARGARQAAEQVARRREGAQREAQPLWGRLADLLESFDAEDTETAAQGLARLALWKTFTDQPLVHTARGFGAALPELAVNEQLLGKLARLLLRARARLWIEEATRLEAEERAGRKRPRPALQTEMRR